MTKNRREYDKYCTPTADLLVKPLLELVNVAGDILEPCAGDRDIARALTDHNLFVMDTDIQDDKNFFSTILDATSPLYWEEMGPVDWVVTNPPFNVAHEILPLAWEKCAKGMAMLLRLSYLEPTSNRGDWLKAMADHQTLVIPINPRPSFTNDGKTDSATVAWFVWEKSHSWKSLGIKSPFQYLNNWR